MARIEVDVEVDIENHLDEVSDKYLIEELEDRGYSVTKSNGLEKCISDTWKDEEIQKAYSVLSWEEWRDMIEEGLKRKGFSA